MPWFRQLFAGVSLRRSGFNTKPVFLSMTQHPLVYQGLLIIQASRSHSDTPHSVELRWKSDQPDAEISTWQHTTLTRDRHPYPKRDSNPQFQAIVRVIIIISLCYSYEVFQILQYFSNLMCFWRHAVAQLFEALRCKPQGRGFDSDSVIGFFHWHNPSGRTMVLGSTQLLTEMSTRNVFWG